MGVTCVGYKNSKYQIKESDPVIELEFTGEDAEKFEQVEAPANPVGRFTSPCRNNF